MTAVLQDVRTRAVVSSTVLEATLRVAGVEPIPHTLVKNYMRAERRKAPRAHPVGWLLHYTDAFLVSPIMFVGGLVVAPLAGGATLLMLLLGTFYLPTLIACGAGVASAVVGGTILFGGMATLLGHPIFMGPAYWYTMAVSDSTWLPAFARSKLARIAAVDPAIHFELAVLEQDEHDLDPVLFAVKGRERVPFCIWDENKQEVFLI